MAGLVVADDRIDALGHISPNFKGLSDRGRIRLAGSVPPICRLVTAASFVPKTAGGAEPRGTPLPLPRRQRWPIISQTLAKTSRRVARLRRRRAARSSAQAEIASRAVGYV